MLFCVPALVVILLGTASFAQDDYDDYRRQADREYSDYLAREAAEYAAYREAVMARWNRFRESTRRTWHRYSEDLNSLSSVDFADGEVRVETIIPVDNPDPEAEAGKNISEQIRRLLSSGDSRDTAVLEGQVAMPSGGIVDSGNVAAFIEEQVVPRIQIEKDTIQSADGVQRIRASASFALVPDHLRLRAERYLPLVRRNCSELDLDVALVMAIIETESYFNPRAQSPAPAYGLMQLVPKSGARDAYRYLHDEDKVVAPSYLFVPENNVALGCAYLAKLRDFEFAAVTDGDNQRLCMVASYNTGPGNVSKSLVGSRSVTKAVRQINRTDSERLFTHLVRHLPYHETRDYLQKVESRIANYLEWR